LPFWAKYTTLRKLKVSKMKTLALTMISLGLVLSAPAFSQEALPDDEIISRGTIQTDPAMSAWNAGDYATAEVEFKRNALCALRAERNFISSVESARENATRSTVGSGVADTIGGSPAPGGGAGGNATTASPSTRLQSNNFKNKFSETKRSCYNRGFQIYMTALSQLKLGKRSDAKASFKRAAAMRKDLYDAHFRLGLLEYQDGNLDKSKKHFKKLKKLESRYKSGEANTEIKAQIKYLKNLLG